MIEGVQKEVAMTQVAMRHPPLTLEPGYANEDGEARGMAPPEWGWFEIVNKTKQGGEIIGILVMLAPSCSLRCVPSERFRPRG